MTEENNQTGKMEALRGNPGDSGRQHLLREKPIITIIELWMQGLYP